MHSAEFQYLLSELTRLRESYVQATPRQRLGVIRQRMENPHANPNVLVATFSGAEAIARSLVMHAKASSKAELSGSYARFRDRPASSLIQEYLKSKGTTPAELFGGEVWATFKLAESYRNLLVHECTFIENIKFDPLVAACNAVLNGIIKLAKIRGAT